MKNALNNLCASGGGGFIVVVALVIALLVIIYVAIMRRGKKCKSCGEKYDSSCIVDARVKRTVQAAMGADMSDVEVLMKCKKCGATNHVQVTVKGDQSERFINEELKKHFDK